MLSEKMIERIYGKKRGWYFTAKDFLDLGTQQSSFKELRPWAGRISQKKQWKKTIQECLYE